MGMPGSLRRGKFFRPALTLCAIGATAAAGAFAAQTVGLIVDRYSLMVEGREIASFTELQVLESSLTVTLGSDGSQKVSKFSDITLKRGATSSLEMWAWHEAARAGDIPAARRNASVIMYGGDGRAVSRWNFTNAWPSKVEYTGVRSGASEVMMETVTITAEHIQRVAP